MTHPVTVPRLACLDGPGVSKVLLEWLTRPYLRMATLVSFTFDLDFQWQFSHAPSLYLAKAIQSAAASADVTIVIANTPARDPVKEARRETVLNLLQRSGVTILTHDTLHAKAFLFEEEGRMCWVVGSSNLTGGGLRTNSEANLRGHHESDYASVRSAVNALVAAARPYVTTRGASDD